ncbi:putative pumilio homolog 8, chloroplastic [Mercurialis annua]|uniref:putative pumilio homolog 8, chloroplastic n=1 Tax=Mercurialis annua TaxID=3986 RepID=UPI002160612F|nr:putative pumilio homolog 8, chloroplastic [Mercurialis annua]
MMGKISEEDQYFNPFNLNHHQQQLQQQQNNPSFQYYSSGSSSSSFSNGFCCSPENGSPFTSERENRINDLIKKKNDAEFLFNNLPYFNPLNHQEMSKFAFSSASSPISSGVNSLQSPEFDTMSPDNPFYKGDVNADEIGCLSRSFGGMNIREEQNGFKMKGFDIDSSAVRFRSHGFDDLRLDDRNFGCNVEKYGGSYVGAGRFDNIEGFQSSSHGVYDEKNGFVSMGCPLFAQNQSNDSYSGSTDYPLEPRGTWSNRGVQSQNSSFAAPCLSDPSAFSQHSKMDFNGDMGVIDSFSAFQSMNPKLDLNVYRSLLLEEKMRSMKNNDYSRMSMEGKQDMEAFSREDSYILQGDVSNHLCNKEGNLFGKMPMKNLRGKGIKLDTRTINGGIWENSHGLSGYSPLSMVPTMNSLSEVRGKIYFMARDQYGCRWLQRIFDEGTHQDVQLIFEEIIDHVVELMLQPFGNYVIQKFLDVCNEDQRLHVVLMVTQEPGRLLRICLNTYGTRAIQKLIETLKTRQQISFVVLALKPGFLDLVKDQNGNHVIQRCLQCLNNGDNKFIFDAAAKFCVQIATHRHGCCVMQRCITHSSGKYKEKLITEISKNALFLAQDQFGNYVVQYIIELKSPFAVDNLVSQFRRHYVLLSMQKFSSHVVEKCLKHLEQSREQIIHELISVSRFEQLLQDPFANYVIQSALSVTKGPLRSSLIAAVRPHMVLRSNPYSKRIFSRNLLKK